LTKTPLIYNVSIGGELVLCLEELSPLKSPVATGLRK